MSREETKQFLAMLKAAYPHFYAKQSDAELSAAINLWAAALASFNKEHVMAGFMPLVQGCKFPPSVAEVIAAAKESVPDKMDILAQQAEYRRLNKGQIAEEVGNVPLALGQQQANRGAYVTI